MPVIKAALLERWLPMHPQRCAPAVAARDPIDLYLLRRPVRQQRQHPRLYCAGRSDKIAGRTPHSSGLPATPAATQFGSPLAFGLLEQKIHARLPGELDVLCLGCRRYQRCPRVPV